MPVLAAVIGAITTGLFYWFCYGDGMSQIDRFLADRRNAKLRAKSQIAYRAAPVRTIREPADAAGVLMYHVAMARGTPTPEQEAAIEAELVQITPPGDDLGSRLAYIRHAANQADDATMAIDHLAPLLRDKLDRSERADLERMLVAVAEIHQGPTPAQDDFIHRTIRALATA